jgi:hypothetical protein
MEGQADTVKCLVQRHRVRTARKDRRGLTAYRLAVELGHSDIQIVLVGDKPF